MVAHITNDLNHLSLLFRKGNASKGNGDQSRSGHYARAAVGTMQKATAMSPRKTEIDKGKTILEHSSSSSEESEDDENSSTTPDNASVSTGSAPYEKPRQFTTAAAAHYELLANQNLNMEKGFNPEFMNANPFIKDRVKDHDLGSLVAAKRKANSSFVKKFYAEAAGRKRDRVKVRGHWVRYDSATINQVLGLKTPDSCAISTLMQGTTEDNEDEMAKALVVEGKSWELDGRRKCIRPKHLTTEAATGEASVAFAVGTGPSQIDPQSASIPTQTADTLVMVLAELQKMNSRLTSIEDRMRESERSIEFVWSYMRDREEVHRKYLASKEHLLAQELPLFPPGICPIASSPEDDPFTTPTTTTPTNGSEGL
ncbi:hypothetical protein L6452_35440 [Arctium lappa]|uniref:Uncharacterized protein n=1 Tax=Arctium lappa TaxID=4217 RepID=A0ACB8Y5Q2_ARCLA|nr:hypothetical protein L6452_35440 [Arctium lappa]